MDRIKHDQLADELWIIEQGIKRCKEDMKEHIENDNYFALKNIIEIYGNYRHRKLTILEEIQEILNY